jgi:altronate dehydratase
MMLGFERADGRKGIRNYVLVAYLVECAHHVARAITRPFEDRAPSSSASRAAIRTPTRRR